MSRRRVRMRRRHTRKKNPGGFSLLMIGIGLVGVFVVAKKLIPALQAQSTATGAGASTPTVHDIGSGSAAWQQLQAMASDPTAGQTTTATSAGADAVSTLNTNLIGSALASSGI